MKTQRKEFVALDKCENDNVWMVLFDENETITHGVKLTPRDIEQLIAELQKKIGEEPKEKKK